MFACSTPYRLRISEFVSARKSSFLSTKYANTSCASSVPVDASAIVRGTLWVVVVAIAVDEDKDEDEEVIDCAGDNESEANPLAASALLAMGEVAKELPATDSSSSVGRLHSTQRRNHRTAPVRREAACCFCSGLSGVVSETPGLAASATIEAAFAIAFFAAAAPLFPGVSALLRKPALRLGVRIFFRLTALLVLRFARRRSVLCFPMLEQFTRHGDCRRSPENVLLLVAMYYKKKKKKYGG